MDNASLTISLAMVAGVLSQSLASHLRLPGIVVLLAVGVLLGPDVGNLVRPEVMGEEGLPAFVGFAVAIILFEGGMQMNLKRLRRQALTIRRLVTVGALVTAIGGGLAARVAMGWPWSISFLFGTLVIVTGPTVITPLLHRFHIKKDTAIILEAEGIFIDAIGATVAVVALDVVMVGTTTSAAVGVLDVAWRIGVGAVIGVGAGAFLAVLIRWRDVIPHGLENILSLAVAIASFHIANSVVHESGITAAIVAGMVISNTQSHAFEEIVEFKEQLTSFSIATLFVLLAADVRVQSVIDIAGPGLIVVALLMFVVRPLSVLASTWGADVSWQQQLFFSWLAPRGIVAAAVASLFAVELAANSVEGGREMRALVFLVIACTVTLQGLTGGILAKLLGLARPKDHGYLILGANVLARRIARELHESGEAVTLMDSNEDCCAAAQKEGLSVIYGNGLEERTMIRGMVDSRKATLALTPNEHVNFLYAKRVKEHFNSIRTLVALETESSGVTSKMVNKLPAGILFGGERPLGLWMRSMLSDSLSEEKWELGFPGDPVDFSKSPGNAILPLILHRAGTRFPVEPEQSPQKQDIILVLIRPEQRETAYQWLRDSGFVPADAGLPAEAS
ncbi:MAG: sodium:proton antiporter [Myxococcales bacterium]|nr:sodium:proton antiporter [Myxococcales bacterium]